MFTGPAEEAVNAKVGKAGSVRKGGGMLGRGSINRAGLVIGKGDQDLLVYRKAVKRRCGDQITEGSEKAR